MTCCVRTGMKFQGTLSYLKTSENDVKLEDNSILRISRINDEVARIYLVDAGDNSIPIPGNFVFRNLTTGEVVQAFRHEYLISWTAKYELKRGDETVLNIDYQRQQAIRSRKEIKDTTPDDHKKKSDEKNEEESMMDFTTTSLDAIEDREST